MKSSVQKQVQEANAMLGAAISRTREVLSGRLSFSSESIRAIAVPVAQMAPVVSRAIELRAADLTLAADLKAYEDNLAALQITLEQVRFMLLGQQDHLDKSRSHLETVNLWATAFNQTR